LLVVIAIIAILAAMLLPALGKAKAKAQAVQCMNSGKQLMLGWRLYADDNADGIPYANGTAGGRPNWMTGTLNFAPGNTANWNVDNDVSKSPLYPFIKNPKTWRCAGDASGRVRSISMSQVFGNGEWLADGPNANQTAYWTYSKISLIQRPSEIWVTIDEHPNSINDAGFGVVCLNATIPAAAKLIDFPANTHGGSAGVSFADGHAEIHKFVSGTIKNAKVNYAPNNTDWLYPATGATDKSLYRDVTWLAERTSIKK